jgi:hypothetical protein
MRRAAEISLPARLVDQVDGYARAVKKQSGVEVTRRAAAHALLRLGLREVARAERKR